MGDVRNVAPTVTPAVPPLSCGDSVSLDVVAGQSPHRIERTFIVPHAGYVTFSSCRSRNDTTLYIDDQEFLPCSRSFTCHGPAHGQWAVDDSCGAGNWNSRVTVSVAILKAGPPHYVVKLQFYDDAAEGILSLMIKCETDPTSSPTTHTPTGQGVTFSPTVVPTITQPTISCVPPCTECGYGDSDDDYNTPFGTLQFSCEMASTVVMPGNFDPATESIYLKANLITSIPEDAFQKLTRLLYLDASINRITNIPGGVFRGLTRLDCLRLENNRITVVPEVFHDLTMLTYLSLGVNFITSIMEGAFQTLLRLTYLQLDSTPIVSMPMPLFPPEIANKLGWARWTSQTSGLQNCLVNFTDLCDRFQNCTNLMVVCDDNCYAPSSTVAVHKPSPSLNSTTMMLVCEPFRLDPEMLEDSVCGRELSKLKTFIGNLSPVFFTNETVSIPAFTHCNKSELFDQIYDTSKLNYAIIFTDQDGARVDGSGGKTPVVNSDSGYVSITPEPAAENITYHASLVARDTSDHDVSLAEWEFTVKKDLEAGLKVDSAEQTNVTKANRPTMDLGWDDRVEWAIGTAYSIAPVSLSGVRHNNKPLQDHQSVTFTLSPSPDGLGINPTNGAIFGTPRIVQNVTSTLIAVLLGESGAGITLHIANVSFNVQHSDEYSPKYGPGGKGCAHGNPLDTIEFDQVFSCNCTGSGFHGPNCATSNASSSTETAQTVGTVLGVVAALLLLGLAVVRHQLHVEKNRPANVGAMQAELLERLGISLPTDIGPHEFGIALTLLVTNDGDDDDDALLDLDLNAEDTYEDTLDTELQPMLSTTFNAAFNIADPAGSAAIATPAAAPRPSSTAGTSKLGDELIESRQFQQELTAALTQCVPLLSAPMERMRISTTSSLVRGTIEILVVVPRLPRLGDLSVVAALSLAAAKRQLAIGAHSVSAACLAMPRQIPREIGRKDVLRIELLGEGAAAEVHKYQLSEPQRGTPPFLVAAKTAKAADNGGATRTELLEEAAMLALLNHRNILPLVGVVTVPRDLPALVLLMYCERGTLKDHVANAGVGGINTATLLTFCAEVLQALHYISSRRIVHRDIAARNVLLDANEVCKLADFGRAVALADIGKEYAKLSNISRSQSE